MTAIRASIAKEAASAPVNATGSAGIGIGLFAAAGIALNMAHPPAAGSLVFAAFLSFMLAGLALIGAHEEAGSSFHKAMRAAVRFAAPLLAAVLLWSAISLSRAAFDAPALATIFALPIFAAILAAESLAAAAFQIAVSRISGMDPGIPVALLVADKFAGLAGELR